MTRTHQDNTPSSPPATAAANESHHPGVFPTGSTPAKKKYGPDLPYGAVQPTFQKARKALADEMNGRWLGAMPVNAFLEKYLPIPQDTLDKLPDTSEDLFDDVPKYGPEKDIYDKFISGTRKWMPDLQAVNTSTKGDTENKVNLKTDISVYRRVEGAAAPDRTDFSKIEFWLEFKTNKHGAAFQDPSSEEEYQAFKENGSFTPDTQLGMDARGQLAHYAGAHHSLQFRHFSFSVVVQGDLSRFLRWDPSGAVVTAAFDYHKDPCLMAEFLWRFNHLSAEQRGHDMSVEPADLTDEVAAHIRKKLEIKDENVPLYRYEIPGMLNGMGYVYAPRLPTQNRSLVSRCTRTSAGYWIPNKDIDSNTQTCEEHESSSQCDMEKRPAKEKETLQQWTDERIIYVKDTWRFLSSDPLAHVIPEHEIYKILYEHGTPNIPESVTGGDLKGGMTQTTELLNHEAEWLCVKPSMSQYQHYRLVQGTVGRPLFKFDSTKQLVSVIFDALRAHSHAFNSAKLLHRDVSAGNIIVTKAGKGLLIDWEMAKTLDDRGSRRPDRTGTWQFMSAMLLQHPGTTHTLADDLESFLHVLAWTMLRYVPAVESYSAVRRGEEMVDMFDVRHREEGQSEWGGARKRLSLAAGQYPSSFFQPRFKTPILKLVRKLSEPFKSVYGDSPTDEDRKLPPPPDMSDLELYRSWFDIVRYDEDIRRLGSPDWFLNVIEKALKEDWPTNDKAVTLPISGDDPTPRQQGIRTSQLGVVHSIMERSRGLPSSSKRAASPTPRESGAKRHCSSPAVSGSGT